VKKKVGFCRSGSKNCNNINYLLTIDTHFRDILFTANAYNVQMGGIFVKKLFKSVWVRILSTLFILVFALNFIISVFPPSVFALTARITSLSLLVLSLLILFFIILFTYTIVKKSIRKS